MTRTRLRVTALFIAVMLINAVFTACSIPGSAGSVSVLGPWSGEDENGFRRVLDNFTHETDVHYTYQGTSALHEVLLSDAQKGNPPDIAILFSPGELGQYQHSGKPHRLDDVIAPQQKTYSKQWLELQKLAQRILPCGVGAPERSYPVGPASSRA